jgi:hypothetical protein
MVVGARRVYRNFFANILLVVGIFALGILGQSSPVSAVTGINQQINFQGRLFNTAGATVPDGYYNIQFKIYQDGDGQSVGNATGSPAGTLKWTESHLNSASQGVQVKNGFMSVELGSVTAFGSSVDWNQSVLWLSMNIGSTNASCTPFSSCTPDGEMVPMKRMSSTPYSLNSGQLGGLTSSQFIQLAQGVQTDVSTNTTSIFLNKTAGGNFLELQSSSVNVLTLSNAGDIQFGANANHTLSVATAGAGTAGKSLTVSGGDGGSGTGSTGGDLLLQGGAAGGTNANGGNVTITGGNGTGTGVKGLVSIGPSAYTTVTNSVCSADCTITQSNVDNYGTVIISASTSSIFVTLPAPTNTSAQGRVVYITTAAGSQDFTLRTNSGGNLIDVAMRQNTTSTMIWNGSAWTPGGASNATTLQATYNNGSNPSTTPEIKLDSTRSTIDIQDADTSIGADILNIRGSNAGGLGTVLFGVSDTGRVTIQGTTDQSSAFRVLNSSGDYLLNVNSANGYVINNSTRSPGNEIVNPGFESGGSSVGGEEGWFGSALSSIVSNASFAHTGNYKLQVSANSANTDVYAGSYYEVEAGESLYFEGYVKNSSGTNGDAGIQITWYDKDKGVLSYSTSYSGTPGTNYILRKVSATAPANAVYARVSAAVRSNATVGLFYFDDFYMSRNVEVADTTFRNSEDSSVAFRIQSAGSSQTLFTADTTNNVLKVGDSTGTDTATTILVLDGASADPTTLTNKNGGLFYNTTSGSLKAVIGGSVVDVCTTAVTCSGYSASAGSSISLQGTSPGTAQTGNFNITGTGILTKLQTQDNGSGSSQALTIKSGNSTGGNSGNLVLDVGTATGTLGTITIGHSGVSTTMAGTLSVQGSGSLSLGNASSATGSVVFKTSAGANTVTLLGPSANPTSSYSLTLPTNLGASGECIKTDATGNMYFQGCGVGVNFNMQDAYDNSGTPANVTLASGKDLTFTAADTAGTDPSTLFNLQCGSTCNSTTNGRFAVQNGAVDVFTVSPNGNGITLAANTQIGSGTTNSTQTNFQLDSYNGSTDSGACSTSVNQGAMYYNTSMGSIRSCINGSWSDVSNPDTLGLLTFGIVPSSGSQPYDLPGLVTPGYSGPCKASWASTTTIHIEACTAYSNGRRLSVAATTLSTNSATSTNTNLTTTNRWGHICLDATSGQPSFTSTSGLTSGTAGMPTFSASSPILCIADVVGSSTTAGVIDDIYDVRTFTSAMKEAVTVSTAVELGMMADSSSAGVVPSAACSSGTCSGKLYGLVVATNGSTSAGAPNAIVVSVGPGFVKATSGNAGDFAKASTTAGYASTVTAIPNNAFYYSPGNTRTSYSTTCSAASNCSGSLYVNFIVR